jgi:hypothetical protein
VRHFLCPRMRTKEMAQASPPARQRLEGGLAREVPHRTGYSGLESALRTKEMTQARKQPCATPRPTKIAGRCRFCGNRFVVLMLGRRGRVKPRKVGNEKIRIARLHCWHWRLSPLSVKRKSSIPTGRRGRQN